MTTEDKIKALIKKTNIPKNQKFLTELLERGMLFGGFTDKQTVMIEEMYARYAVKTDCQPRQYALGEIQPKEIAKCWDCADSGFCRVERLEGYEPWATWDSGSAPCHCSRGAELRSAGGRMSPPMDFGPQFNEAWKKSYKINPEYTEVSGVITNHE